MIAVYSRGYIGPPEGPLLSECSVCGSLPDEECRPECDADDLSDDGVARAVLDRLFGEPRSRCLSPTR